MKASDISLCLISKDHIYPQIILDDVRRDGWAEVLLLTDSDSPFRKYELFNKAKSKYLAYQDDDAICPWEQLLANAIPNKINVAMKPGHYTQYAGMKMTMGLGWGSIFPKDILDSLKKYTNIYGEDEIYKRETERILTYLNYPQNRLVLPITDLPSAYDADRLWRQPHHYSNINIVEERCKVL